MEARPTIGRSAVLVVVTAIAMVGVSCQLSPPVQITQRVQNEYTQVIRPALITISETLAEHRLYAIDPAELPLAEDLHQYVRSDLVELVFSAPTGEQVQTDLVVRDIHEALIDRGFRPNPFAASIFTAGNCSIEAYEYPFQTLEIHVFCPNALETSP